jgi:nucleoid-associated protein YgaU
MPIRLSPEGPRRVAALVLACAALVAAAAIGSVFLTTAGTAWTAIAAAGPSSPADGILLTSGLGGTLLSLWLGLGMALSALSALPGAAGQVCRELAARVAPAAVRRVVAFVLGTTLTAALVPGTAVAGIGPQARSGTVAAAAQQAGHGGGTVAVVAAPEASFRLVSGRSPDHLKDVEQVQANEVRQVRDVIEVMDAAPRPAWSLDLPEPTAKAVVVHRGDTLWSIAARHLGPAASLADVDAEWRRWHAANHGVIGDNPNLILPGQLLGPPPAPRAGS